MYASFEPKRIIKRVFGVHPDQIAATVLLSPSKSIVADLENRLKEPKVFGNWFTGVSGFLDDNKFFTILNNVRYAPGMADCVYFLQFAEVKNLIYTGTIGGLAPGMEIGDFVLVTNVERGDGASGYFSSIFEPAEASLMLIEIIQPFLQSVAEEEGYQLYKGRVFTTDSLAAETVEFLTALQSRAFQGIEMETSALYVVAKYSGMHAIAAHVVSDLPLAGKTLFDKLTNKEKERRASAHSAMLNALSQAIKALAPDGD